MRCYERARGRSRFAHCALLMLLQVAMGGVAAQTQPSVVLNFKVGALLATDYSLDCTTLESDIYYGYLFAIQLLNSSKPMIFQDRTGTSYKIQFDFRHYDNKNCSAVVRAPIFNQMVAEVDFVLGQLSNSATMSDSVTANTAKKLLYHCCVTSDEVFARDMPYIFGMFLSSSRYGPPALKAMALSGVKQVAVSLTTDHFFASSTCGPAIQYLDALKALEPDLRMVSLFNDTIDVSDNNALVDSIVTSIIESDADAYLACEVSTPRLVNITRTLRQRGHYLKAMWIAGSANLPTYIAGLGKYADYTIATSQWHPSMTTADPFFGTASTYSLAYTKFSGKLGNHLPAGASATVYTLVLAIQQALANCDLSGTGGDVHQILYNASAVTCWGGASVNGAILNTTGYELIRTTLAATAVDTFFGHVEFNKYRRNVGLVPVVEQVIGGRIACVLPLDEADAQLLMPMPHPPVLGKPWTSNALGVVVISLGCCLGAALLLLAMLVARRRMGPALMSKKQAVTIRYVELAVDIPPGSYYVVDNYHEAGEATYRGARVSLTTAYCLLPSTQARLGLSRNDSHNSRCGTGMERQRETAVLEGDVDFSDVGKKLDTSMEDAASNTDTVTVWTAAPKLPQTHSRKSIDLAAMKSSDSTEKRKTSGSHGQPAPKKPLWSSSVVADLAWRAMRLQHPAVCPTLGVVWEWPALSVPVVVREWCSLGSLASMLDNETMELPMHVRGKVAVQLADAMRYLHAQEPPIVVGNMKAYNIHMDGHFNPKLLLPLTCMDPSYHVIGGRAAEMHAFGMLLCQLFAKRDMTLFDSQPLVSAMPVTSSKSVLQQPKDYIGAREKSATGEWQLMASPDSRTSNKSKLSADRLLMQQEALEKALADIRIISPGLEALIRKCISPNQGVDSQELSWEQISSQLVPAVPSLGADLGQDVMIPEYAGAEADAAAIAGKFRTSPASPATMSVRTHLKSGELHRSGSVLAEDVHLPHITKEDLLFDLFPPKVARALQAGTAVEPERYECVSIFFSDIVGYTDLCSQLAAHEVMDLLHRLYTRFDAVTREMALFKVETIGDAYMAVSNLRWPQPDSHARLLAQYALRVVNVARSVPVHPDRPELGHINIRVGLHSGPVVASVVGTLNRRYCLFGDTVNTASRMESSSEVNRVHCSKAFAELTMLQWPVSRLTSRGLRPIKGKGNMETFWIEEAPTLELVATHSGSVQN